MKGFWAAVKSGLGCGLSKCYITGVSPQSLADNTSGFDAARFVSWEPALAGFCGLKEADVAAALAMEKVCGTTAEAEKHLKIMRDHYSGFNFVPGGQEPLTYNTNTCLEYLQVRFLSQHVRDGLLIPLSAHIYLLTLYNYDILASH